MDSVIVTINDKEYSVKKGTTYKELAKNFSHEFKTPIILAISNNQLKILQKRITKNCTVKFIDMVDKDGFRTYQRSISFVLIKAFYNMYSDIEIIVQYSLNNGYYAEFSDGFIPTEDDIVKIELEMNRIINSGIEIEKEIHKTDEAMEIFKNQNMLDKHDLLKYRRASNINLYKLEDFYDYFYGYMVDNTADLKGKFKLYKYSDGLIIQFIDRKKPDQVSTFEPSAKLFDTLKKSTDWGKSILMDNVADLNNKIVSGDFLQLVLLQESLMEKRIGLIADEIVKNKDKRFVFIAGPSSSGKTTFSRRLSVQLSALGANPKPMSLDNYYVNRVDNPVDEDGNYDFECLEAIDVKQFNSDMKRLLKGEEVDMPSFNFIKGEREYLGNKIVLGEEDILIIEGIHGLNPKLSSEIPEKNKYRVYISSLTALNVDAHNRIPTTDARLIRRIVRDSWERDKTAAETIKMWPKVRQGEEKYIFPYQEQADIMFNSSLIYELSVLKQFVEPLLFNVDRGSIEFIEAKRLIKFLDYFLGVTSEKIPNTSLLREFIGGSFFAHS